MLYVLQLTRNQPHPLTTQCLERISLPHEVVIVRGLPVDEARNALTRMVLQKASDDDIALWLDDDIYFEPGTVEAACIQQSTRRKRSTAKGTLGAPWSQYVTDDV